MGKLLCAFRMIAVSRRRKCYEMFRNERSLDSKPLDQCIVENSRAEKVEKLFACLLHHEIV